MQKGMKTHSRDYWESRWKNGESGWDIEKASPALIELILKNCKKTDSILFPGSGSSYEAALLFLEYGYQNIFICDWASLPLESFKKRCPFFPEKHILHTDFFTLDMSFDFIIEQTFFCAIPPAWRKPYVQKCYERLTDGGRMMGLLFNRAFDRDGPPFGGGREDYELLFGSFFDIDRMEDCLDSIPPRLGSELIFEATKKVKTKAN